MTVDIADAPKTQKKTPTGRASVMVLEFNELCPTLIRKFMDGGHLPNFKKLHDSSQVYVSDAEEAAPNLEPWIQWITVHTGLSYDEHGVFRLGDGHKLDTPSLWDMLSDEGYRVWVCGSMNINYKLPINGAVLPDPWALGCKPYPESFSPYFKFVQKNVQEYTNDRVPLTKADYLAFLKFMASHGLTFGTGVAIARQLVRERLTRKSKWKRAVILDRMQWDVFAAYFKKHRPDFSTFFINSTAHFQHMHWRNMEPSQFKVQPSDEEQREYADAILYGYKQMDALVGKAIALAGKDTTIVFASALGQQACTKYEDLGGKTFCRPRVFERVLEFARVENVRHIEPLMSEEFQLRFDNEADAIAAAERLGELKVGDRRVLAGARNGNDVMSGCKIFEKLPDDAVMTNVGTGQSLPFYRLFYQAEGMKSGMHHPDGILWIRTPGARPATHEAKVPLRDIAPTLLNLFGIDKPGYMSGQVLPVGEQAVPV